MGSLCFSARHEFFFESFFTYFGHLDDQDSNAFLDVSLRLTLVRDAHATSFHYISVSFLGSNPFFRRVSLFPNPARIIFLRADHAEDNECIVVRSGRLLW